MPAGCHLELGTNAQLPRLGLSWHDRSVIMKGSIMGSQGIVGWITDNVETVIAIVSALVAVLSALIARGETRAQRKLQEEELRQRIDAASLDWGNEAINTMGEASALAMNTHLTVADMVAAKLDVARRLSTLVDRGRMFFPNVDAETHGSDREVAFRGKRAPILDVLMYAHYETLRIGEGNVRGDDSAAFITQCRRLLVSELQRHLDPRRLDEVVDRYTEQSLELREGAMDAAGRLGMILDVRRPGVLTQYNDRGWTERVSVEDRRKILHDYGNEER